MNAFGYVRLSKWDADTTSPQRQRKAIEDLCTARGWKLLDTFEDIDVSAYNGKHRHKLSKMLGRLGEVDAIVFMRLDRLARSVVEFKNIRATCEKHRVELVSTDQQIDTSTPIGKAMESIVSVFAEMESDTISARAKQMHEFKRSQGEWVGRTPFGWRRVGKKIEPVPEKQAVLEDVARRYVAGESLRSISESHGMYHGNLAKMLRSDRVIDALPAPLAGKLVTAMSKRGRSGTRAKRSLLGGIARCGVCGGSMTVVGQRQGWAAYSCKQRSHVYISQPWLDAYVEEQVLKALDNGAILKRLEKRKRPTASMASVELEARLEMLERDFYELGRIAQDSYLRRREGILKRLQEARNVEQDAGIDLPREVVLNLSKVWPGMTVIEKRRIVAAVLDRVEVQRATSHGPVEASRVRHVWR